MTDPSPASDSKRQHRLTICEQLNLDLKQQSSWQSLCSCGYKSKWYTTKFRAGSAWARAHKLFYTEDK